MDSEHFLWVGKPFLKKTIVKIILVVAISLIPHSSDIRNDVPPSHLPSHHGVYLCADVHYVTLLT